MKNIALKISFTGTKYHGWQAQKDAITIAGTVQDALTRLCGQRVKVNGCGRTDAGVHAEVYCANFKSDTTIPPDRLPFAVNALLPDDIAVYKATYVPDDFDANLSCIKKEYAYRIICSKIRDPFYAGRAYFYPSFLNTEKMTEAAKHFTGTHDFAAFRSAGTETKTTVRTVFYYDIAQDGQVVQLRACADGFLYNMARALAGTLVYVSEGKINPADIPYLFKQKDRSLTGPTLPPCGLYMTRLYYDGIAGGMFA